MRKDKKIGIYKITSPSGKIYIGQSVNIESRFNDYKSERNIIKQRRLYNSIKKHGWKNHKFEIIHICLVEELNKLELYYEELYNSTNSKTGLNIRKCGGSKGLHNEETKKLIGEANKIAYSTPEQIERCRLLNLGRKRTQETKDKQSSLKKKLYENGFVNPNFGKKFSDETRLKLSLSHMGHKRSKEAIEKTTLKNTGQKRTLEQIERIKAGRLKNNPKKIK